MPGIFSLFRDRETLHKIRVLALPSVVEEALNTVVQYVDTAMVGQIGAAASAAVGLTMTCNWLICSPLWAMGVGILACVARSIGAGEREKARRYAFQSLWIGGFLGVLIAVLVQLLAPQIPVWLGAEPEIRADASAYFAIICMPMLFRALSILLSATLRSAGDSKTPMKINMSANILNMILNYLLIHPTHAVRIAGLRFTVWGAGLGVRGAAVATALAFALSGTLMFAAYLRHPMLSPLGHRGETGILPNPALLKDILHIGLPSAGERLTACLGQVVFTSLVSGLGTVSLAAHSIALTAEEAFYIPGYGMQAAAATLAGNALGEKNVKKLQRTSVTIAFLAFTIMGLMGIILFCFPSAMMGIFTNDSAVIALGSVALRIVAVSEPLFGVAIIMEGVFNGIGETKTTFLFSAFTMWGIRILFTFLCVRVFGLGLTAVWCCMVADNVARCLLLCAKFMRGRWKSKVAA
ncbi:MAG: MATE family efflux transporter [Ruminococcus bromii]|nr:MATE family efflux transporter [Ruminococcus bromii]